MGVFYRLGQFWRIVTAVPLSPLARQEVRATLSDAEYALFGRYALSDQWHSYRVYRMLCEAGYTHPDLLTAALLHDVGKTRVSLTVWHRTWIVLGQLFWPSKLATWGEGEARGWKRPFVVKAQHPEWGAEMAAAVGSRALAVALIRQHQDRVPETADTEIAHLLRPLQWADDQN